MTVLSPEAAAVGNAGGVYLIDTSNAVATLVNRLTVPLDPSASSFGVDFNPAADRLRITSSSGQNLRHNVNAGGSTVNDSTLDYTPGSPAIGVVGSAYTNNDLNAATATTLYALDSNLNQIALQSPANAGTLAATGSLTAQCDRNRDTVEPASSGASVAGMEAPPI